MLSKMGKKTGPQRPNKQDQQTISKLLSLIKIDATVKEACDYARIHENTFWNWYKDKREFLWEFEEIEYDIDDKKKSYKYTDVSTFRELVEQARAWKFVLAKKTLLGAVMKGNAGYAIELLKRRSPDYFDKQVIANDRSILAQDVMKKLKNAKTRKSKNDVSRRSKGAKGGGA